MSGISNMVFMLTDKLIIDLAHGNQLFVVEFTFDIKECYQKLINLVVILLS